MRATTRIACLLLAAFCLSACSRHGQETTSAEPKRAAQRPSPIPDDRTQLVTVVSNRWTDYRATLRRYERKPGEKWQQAGAPVDAVLGREGYGWGRGLHGNGGPDGHPGPLKREGDGRSPAGVFEIGAAYGYAAARKDLSIPYVQASNDLRCVDDPQSEHYNRIVSTTDTEIDWTSAERMRRDDDLYVLALVVEHNTKSTRRAAGSCIFLHLWEGPDKGMNGCTAMSRDALEELAAWLDRDAAVLVALPLGEYELLRRPWHLPLLAKPADRRSR
jgi:D-alanyl-D-alanine dipeptidase